MSKYDQAHSLGLPSVNHGQPSFFGPEAKRFNSRLFSATQKVNRRQAAYVGAGLGIAILGATYTGESEVSAQGTIPSPPPVDESKQVFMPMVSNDTPFTSEHNVFLPAISGPIAVQKESKKVRVGSFNAHDKNLDSIEPVVREMVNDGANFIAFQEVFDPDVDMLTRVMGMDCRRGSGNVAICDTNRQGSKWGFSGSVAVQELRDPSGRVMLCAKVAEGSDAPSAVFCGTHLVHTNAEGQLGQVTEHINNEVLSGAVFASGDENPQQHEPLPVVLAMDSNIPNDERVMEITDLDGSHLSCTPEVPCEGEVNPVRGPVDRVIVYPNPMDPAQTLAINLADATRGQIVPQSDHTFVLTTMEVTEHVGVAEATDVSMAQNIYYQASYSP